MAVTPNLGLHQWQAGDAFLREDFNGDFWKIDTAVGSAPENAHAAGFYVGNNDYAKTLTVPVGFAPTAVLIFNVTYKVGFYDSVMATRDKPAEGYGNSVMVKLTNTGFEVFQPVDSSKNPTQPYVKVGGQTYCYIAFR